MGVPTVEGIASIALRNWNQPSHAASPVEPHPAARCAHAAVCTVNDANRRGFPSVTGAICFGDSGGSLVMNDASVKGPVLVGVLFAEEIGDGDCARNQAINSVDLYYYSRWIHDVSSVAPTVPPRTVFEVFGDGVVARDVARKSVRETICNQRWVSGKQAKFVTSLADAVAKNTLRADPDFASPVRYPDALIPVALGGEFSVKNIAWFSTDPLDRHSKENRSATAAAISARVCAGKITFAKGLAIYRAYLNKYGSVT